jgi:hypothetical protein
VENYFSSPKVHMRSIQLKDADLIRNALVGAPQEALDGLDALSRQSYRNYRVLIKNWDHQFCLWGLDIKESGRDFLKMFGLEKIPRQSEYSNSPAYVDRTRSVLSFDVCLWAFGVYLAVPNQGVWVWSRHGLRLGFVPCGDLVDPWRILMKPGLVRRPHVAELYEGVQTIRDFLEWVSGYEQWVQDSFGLAHRGKAAPSSRSLCFYWGDVAPRIQVAHFARVPRLGLL